MVETHTEQTEQDLADKRANTNWADEVDGGDDDETEIGGESVAQVPVVEKKEEKVYVVPTRVRNAHGDFVVTTIKLKELEARPVEVKEVNADDDSEESEESP